MLLKILRQTSLRDHQKDQHLIKMKTKKIRSITFSREISYNKTVKSKSNRQNNIC